MQHDLPFILCVLLHMYVRAHLSHATITVAGGQKIMLIFSHATHAGVSAHNDTIVDIIIMSQAAYEPY